MKAQRSLKSRALQLLAQRDQSRVELRRKLVRHARCMAGEEEADGQPAAAQIEVLLDWLEKNGYLSDERFVESRVHARADRFGTLRIRGELAQHGVAMSPQAEGVLAESELERAATVRARRYAEWPRDAKERAAQMRFLAGRGFSSELIHRLLRHALSR